MDILRKLVLASTNLWLYCSSYYIVIPIDLMMIASILVAMMLWWKPAGQAPAFTTVQNATFVSRSSPI